MQTDNFYWIKLIFQFVSDNPQVGETHELFMFLISSNLKIYAIVQTIYSNRQ